MGKSHGAPQSTREEMEIALAHAKDLRALSAKLPDPPRESFRASLDKFEADVKRKGLDNFKFFDTIPFYDRLKRMDKVVRQHVG